MDYNKTFAPVVRLSSIRLAIARTVRHNMHIRQFDITTAYLNGVIKEEIFMEVPQHTKEILEFIMQRKCTSPKFITDAKKTLGLLAQDRVCRMKKSLYGLKQAGRCWYERLDAELTKFGAKPGAGDQSVYVKGAGDNVLLIIVYVDDMVILSRNLEEINRAYKFLQRSFDVKDLGGIKYCLGIEYSR